MLLWFLSIKQLREVPANFYKFALLHLSYTPLELIEDEDRKQLAYDLSIAALVGEDIFNFGDLVKDPPHHKH